MSSWEILLCILLIVLIGKMVFKLTGTLLKWVVIIGGLYMIIQYFGC